MSTQSLQGVASPKLKAHEHVIAGLPLLLLIVGGAIGGAVGGGAYAWSASVFKKDIPQSRKYIYSASITLGAVVVYVGVILCLAVLFPALFSQE